MSSKNKNKFMTSILLGSPSREKNQSQVWVIPEVSSGGFFIIKNLQIFGKKSLTSSRDSSYLQLRSDQRLNESPVQLTSRHRNVIFQTFRLGDPHVVLKIWEGRFFCLHFSHFSETKQPSYSGISRSTESSPFSGDSAALALTAPACPG